MGSPSAMHQKYTALKPSPPKCLPQLDNRLPQALGGKWTPSHPSCTHHPPRSRDPGTEWPQRLTNGILSLLARRPSQRAAMSNALQHISPNLMSPGARQSLRQSQGLVEPSFPMPAPVQRHRNQDTPGRRLRPPCGQPTAQGPRDPRKSAVLHAMHKLLCAVKPGHSKTSRHVIPIGSLPDQRLATGGVDDRPIHATRRTNPRNVIDRQAQSASPTIASKHDAKFFKLPNP